MDFAMVRAFRSCRPLRRGSGDFQLGLARGRLARQTVVKGLFEVAHRSAHRCCIGPFADFRKRCQATDGGRDLIGPLGEMLPAGFGEVISLRGPSLSPFRGKPHIEEQCHGRVDYAR